MIRYVHVAIAPTNDEEWAAMVQGWLQRQRTIQLQQQARANAVKAKRPKKRRGPKLTRKQRAAQRRNHA